MIAITILFIIILVIMLYTLNKVIDVSAKVSDCERKNSDRYRNLLSSIDGVKLQICRNFDKLLEVEEAINSTKEVDGGVCIPPVEVENSITAVETKSYNSKKYKKNKKSNNKK